MARLGFLYSIELKRYGSQRLRLIYRPFALWFFAAAISLILGILCAFILMNTADFRLLVGVSCFGLLCIGVDLLRHLGSVVDIDFDKTTGRILYKKTLFTTHFQQPLKLERLVRVEAIATKGFTPKLCLLFTTVNPIYLDLFFCRTPHHLAYELNKFLLPNLENLSIEFEGQSVH